MQVRRAKLGVEKSKLERPLPNTSTELVMNWDLLALFYQKPRSYFGKGSLIDPERTRHSLLPFRIFSRESLKVDVSYINFTKLIT